MSQMLEFLIDVYRILSEMYLERITFNVYAIIKETAASELGSKMDCPYFLCL